jgi:hypothetical protein
MALRRLPRQTNPSRAAGLGVLGGLVAKTARGAELELAVLIVDFEASAMAMQLIGRRRKASPSRRLVQGTGDKRLG